MSTQAAREKELHAIIIEAFREAEVHCTLPWVLDYATNLPGTQITFKQLMVILSGAAWIVIAIICTYLLIGHLRYYSRPKEQRQIIRIILFIPVYGLLAFFSVLFDHLSGYLAPYGQWADGIALMALFLLYVEISSPDGATREAFFDNLERRLHSGKKKGNGGSLRWFRGLNIMVFQLFFTRIATVVGINVLYSQTCPLSSTRANGQTALSVIQGFSTGVALTGCILLEKRLRPKMQEHKALFKLLSFKIIIGLDAIQVFIFPTLAENKVYEPSPPWRVSWNDFALALPNFILMMEMILVAISYLWSFDFSRYRTRTLQAGAPLKMGPGAAIFDALFLRDLWAGVAYALWGRIPSSWFKSAEGIEMSGGAGSHAYQPVETDNLKTDYVQAEA